MDNKKQRVNITVPWDMYEWYKDKANDMGTSMSFMMILAMKTYMDQQKTLEMSKDMPAMLNQLKELGFQMVVKADEE